MILTFFVVIAVVLCVVHLFREYEGFTSLPSAPYSDKTAMTYDEENEYDPRDLEWISSWSDTDKRARRGNNCAKTYEEKGPNNTMIYTTSNSCENGLPHTRLGDRIIIPDSVPITDRARIIRHELVHIHQRRNPAVWETFYRRAWSFVLYKDPPTDIAPEIVLSRRANPDTFEKPWACWMGRWWVLAVYDDIKNPKIKDAHTIWWDSWRREAKEEPPENWLSFFGDPAQIEHPHEIAATILVEHDTSSEAGRRLLTNTEMSSLIREVSP